MYATFRVAYFVLSRFDLYFSVPPLCSYLRQVLRTDPHNVFAANGIGCLLAAQRDFTRAKDVFLKVMITLCCPLLCFALLCFALFVDFGCCILTKQVREATSFDDINMMDSWMNLAHCYVELVCPPSRSDCLTRFSGFWCLTPAGSV